MTYGILETGDSWFGDGVCTGYPKCGSGGHATCIRFIGPDFTTCHGVHYSPSDCDFYSSSLVTLYYYSGGSWIYLVSGNRPGAYAYSWICFNHVGYTQPLYLKAHDAETNTDSYFYFNWFYLTVNVKDLLGNPITDCSVFVDGNSIGPGGSTALLSKGNHIITISRDITCAGKIFDNWASTECSWSVNLTTDYTLETTICMINACRDYDFTLYHGSYFYITCDGTSGGSQPWRSPAFVCYIGASIIEDNDHADLCLKMPWDSGANECCDYGVLGCKYIDAYPNTAYEWTDGIDVYSILTGDLWASGASRWIEIKKVCWATRDNYGTIDDIDKSQVYVDCAAGSNNNTGLCSFDYALATITHAQTIVDDGGTIYVKYGNCLNETLVDVLNPIVTTVHISPRASDSVEGTGSVVINGT